MCKIYNTIGSLTTLKSHLDSNNIEEFNSLDSIIDFQNSYLNIRQQLIAHHEDLIKQEKNTLVEDLEHLSQAIDEGRREAVLKLTDDVNNLQQKLNFASSTFPTSFFGRLKKDVTLWYYKTIIDYKKNHFNSNVQKSIRILLDTQQFKENRYQFINYCFDDAVNQSSEYPLSELDRKKAILDELNNYVLGAIGEQKVVEALEELSDDYCLINDFSVSFTPALYNKGENGYIKSVQIDHILVGPSGVFLIETKNWSLKSQADLSLRSPVQQIKRTSFALFLLLNNDKSKSTLRLNKHHWGDKKISVRNLIVFANSKPQEEFQYVKIVTIYELLGYVEYFKPVFSPGEVQEIANYLLNLNSQKTIKTN